MALLRLLLLGDDERKSESGQSAIASGLLRELETASQSQTSKDSEGVAPNFTIVDAASDDIVGDLLTGAAWADAAVLVVGAARGRLQWAIREGGRVRELMLLTATLGFKSLVVCVDQIGLESELCAEQRFEEVRRELKELLELAGFEPRSIPCVPVADLAGVDAAVSFPWHSGPSLMDAIISAKACPDLSGKPLRVPLHEVYKVRGAEIVAVGRVEMGVLREGAELALSPVDAVVSARRIEMEGQPIQEAQPGDWVRFIGLSEDGEVSTDAAQGQTQQVSRPLRFEVGNVMCEATRGAAKACSCFIAEFVVLRDPPKGFIQNGYQPTLDVHTAHVKCTISELRWRRPSGGAHRLEQCPSVLAAGDIAEAWVRPEAPVCLEVFSFCPPLGRFALCDQELTVAAGVVKDVRRTAQQIACFDD